MRKYYLVCIDILNPKRLKQCKLLGDYAAVVSNNIKGTISYQNNRVRNRLAYMVKDTKSIIPNHDFKYVLLSGRENLLMEYPSDKELAANTRTMHALLDAAEACGSRYYASEPGLGHTKSCNKCMCIEKRRNSEKMKYCIKCRKVCYCSKECQKADWGDHKLICQS